MPEPSVAMSAQLNMSAVPSMDMTTTGHTHQADVTPEPPQHHGEELVGLCLAVLVALLMFGLALGRRGSRPLAAWLPAAYTGLLGFARERVPRPPDLLALSIQRC
jgi:hypothetical protein